MPSIGITGGINRALILMSILAQFVICGGAPAQEARESDIEVTASAEEFEELGGEGQPQWAERSRASSTTKLYVLSPYEIFAGILYEGDFRRGGRTTHDLTQEIELGLPNRFEIGFENHLGFSDRRSGETMADIEARYAFANWEKLLLNPAISAAYKFGAGPSSPRRVGDRTGGRGAIDSQRDQPDAFELRLLLGQELSRIQWASNLFFEKELSGRQNLKTGFTQDVAYVMIPDKLTLGVEMRYTHDTRGDDRRGSADEFIIGPSMAWKPNRHTVASLAPLFGCTHDSPGAAAFVSVSVEFGGGESKKPEPSKAK